MIPKEICNECLYPTQKYIKLIDEAIGFSCMCEIKEGEGEEDMQSKMSYLMRDFMATTEEHKHCRR